LPSGISLQYDLRSALTLGAEVFAAYTENDGLGKSSSGYGWGGRYVIPDGLNFCSGVLGGNTSRAPASTDRSDPRSIFPDLFHSSSRSSVRGRTFTSQPRTSAYRTVWLVGLSGSVDVATKMASSDPVQWLEQDYDAWDLIFVLLLTGTVANDLIFISRAKRGWPVGSSS
jgi:hypothetical protein